MSRQNKVNPDHYTTAGRLSPDDLARERTKQRSSGMGRSGKERPMPPWMLHPEAAQPTPPVASEPVEAAGESDDAPVTTTPKRVNSRKTKRPAAAAKPRAGQKRLSASKTTAKRTAKSAKRKASTAAARPATARRAGAGKARGAKTRGAKRSATAPSRATASTARARSAKNARGTTRKTSRKR